MHAPNALGKRILASIRWRAWYLVPRLRRLNPSDFSSCENTPTRRPSAGAQVARKPIVPVLLKRVFNHVMPKPYCLLQTQLFSLCERIRIFILCQFCAACDVAFVPSYF